MPVGKREMYRSQDLQCILCCAAARPLYIAEAHYPSAQHAAHYLWQGAVCTCMPQISNATAAFALPKSYL